MTMQEALEAARQAAWDAGNDAAAASIQAIIDRFCA